MLSWGYGGDAEGGWWRRGCLWYWFSLLYKFRWIIQATLYLSTHFNNSIDFQHFSFYFHFLLSSYICIDGISCTPQYNHHHMSLFFHFPYTSIDRCYYDCLADDGNGRKNDPWNYFEGYSQYALNVPTYIWGTCFLCILH